jgi:hypothetical protein
MKWFSYLLSKLARVASPTSRSPAEPEDGPSDAKVLDPTRLAFRPYHHEQNAAGEWVVLRENTLADVIRDIYLRNTVLWLLGYDARQPLAEQINDAPMRSQQVGSPWQAAWNVRTLLRARGIYAQHDPALVREIDKKLELAIPWCHQPG